jgi:hypothetical protein
MKNILLYILVGLNLALTFYLFSKMPVTSSTEDKPTTEVPTEEPELAIHMGRLQLYMNKLYFAGINQNDALAAFYIHELEEAMEEIVAAKIVDEGIDISMNTQLFGLNQLENFEKQIENNSTDFTEAYALLVKSCNNCHSVSKHPFIVIKEPTNPVFDNQVYEVVK